MNSREFEKLVWETLQNTAVYYPLQIGGVRLLKNGDTSDGTLEILWHGKTVPFVFQAKSRSAPTVVATQLEPLQNLALVAEKYPLVVVPYISAALQDFLAEAEISAIDLNGNFVLQTPELLAIRRDVPNQFPERQPIKKIYRGTSSLVGRYLLRGPNNATTIGGIRESIENLGGRVSLSTVSKVVSGMADELIVEKKDGIKTIQPDKLLKRLRAQYQRPKTTDLMKLALPYDGLDDERDRTFFDENIQGEWVWSAPASQHRYTAAPRSEGTIRSLFVRRSSFTSLREFENERFFDCIVYATDDDTPFFDQNAQWASDVETCLALTSGDKRENEMAEQIAGQILQRF